MSCTVTIVSNNREEVFKAEKGTNLLLFLNKNSPVISSFCGGRGICGKCKIRILKGEVSKITGAELDLFTEREIKSGYRLACMINIEDHLVIEPVSLMGEIKVVSRGSRIKIEDRPEIDLPVRDIYGLVVDIGTTTVVIYLLNLSTGEELDIQSFHNPQWKFGADVLSRIAYTEKSGSTQEVQAVLIRELNQAIVRLSSRNKISLKDIYRVLVVGNTIMLHFFLGIDPQSMARAPYNPVFTEKRRISPDKVKLKINQKGIVETLPVVSAFIGADIIADLLLIDMDIDGEWKLLIDIGTNGEIVLGNKEQILACSVAAGPAFEGASITCGTAGIPGAISSFRIKKNKEFFYETINSNPVIGICGSGLIDIVAEFLNKGVITKTGLFSERMEPEILNKLIYRKNMKALKIAGDDQSPILLTQKDVRELQLAKGAIAAGINILLKEAGISYNDLKKVYLAGGFGEYINIDNAIKIGLLPIKSKEKVYKLGNGAGMGARVYLLDPQQEARANHFSKKIEYLELSLRNDFQREFIKFLNF